MDEILIISSGLHLEHLNVKERFYSCFLKKRRCSWIALRLPGEVGKVGKVIELDGLLNHQCVDKTHFILINAYLSRELLLYQ